MFTLDLVAAALALISIVLLCGNFVSHSILDPVQIITEDATAPPQMAASAAEVPVLGQFVRNEAYQKMKESSTASPPRLGLAFGWPSHMIGDERWIVDHVDG